MRRSGTSSTFEQVDDYTVKVRWKKPYFLSEEATLMVPIMPRHVYSVDADGDLISLDFSSAGVRRGAQQSLGQHAHVRHRPA